MEHSLFLFVLGVHLTLGFSSLNIKSFRFGVGNKSTAKLELAKKFYITHSLKNELEIIEDCLNIFHTAGVLKMQFQ